MLCCWGLAVITSAQTNTKTNVCHVTGKAPRQVPTTTFELQLSPPRCFSLRENLTIKKLVCTRGEEEGLRMLRKFPRSSRDHRFKQSLSYRLKRRKKEQSQKEKSASKGTGSPVLWQVRESAGTTTWTLPMTLSCLRVPPSKEGSEPCVGVRTMHLRAAGLQLSELFPR